MSDLLNKNDYEEPACLFCDPRTGEQKNNASIPMQRITDKFEEYCTLKDYAGAERHLKYWLEEAKALGDLAGQFSLRNEMMGFYRKQGNYENAVASLKEALVLMEALGNEYSISGGTCHVNCGTVYDNFADPENALPHFEKAEEIFDSISYKDNYRLASLYNNMGLALMDLKQFPEAMEKYHKALETIRSVEGSEPEQAVTYLNMADCAALGRGLEETTSEINSYLSIAKELLDTEGIPRDGYYAFICEKCAPGFNCYGFFEYAAELEARAEAIYGDAADGNGDAAN